MYGISTSVLHLYVLVYGTNAVYIHSLYICILLLWYLYFILYINVQRILISSLYLIEIHQLPIQ